VDDSKDKKKKKKKKNKREEDEEIIMDAEKIEATLDPEAKQASFKETIFY